MTPKRALLCIAETCENTSSMAPVEDLRAKLSKVAELARETLREKRPQAKSTPRANRASH